MPLSDLLPSAPQSADDPRAIDPETGCAWAPLQLTAGVKRYLKAVYGLERAVQTIAHDRMKGLGPRWLYHGQVPVTPLAEIDRDVRERLLRPMSPLAEAARARNEQRKAQQLLPLPSAPPPAKQRAGRKAKQPAKLQSGNRAKAQQGDHS
jgi:hypothetical protein